MKCTLPSSTKQIKFRNKDTCTLKLDCRNGIIQLDIHSDRKKERKKKKEHLIFVSSFSAAVTKTAASTVATFFLLEQMNFKKIMNKNNHPLAREDLPDVISSSPFFPLHKNSTAVETSLTFHGVNLSTIFSE
ncbi:hypothetical protein CEXT_503291 [Caerostris extrusa]|uniref:Uncharacterized protein n=1 Tax=Caerostris extrusa TaxID=172846 RepID=A0AAV4P196_CAEEX|nr:hypothetical protein CEXT_503291 [Caerostris extrusa]